jgi:hypothetical protein
MGSSLKRFVLVAAILGTTFSTLPAAISATSTQPSLGNIAMERALWRLKIPTGKVDGVFDGQTRRALCTWRELTGKYADRALPTQEEIIEVTYTEHLFPSTQMQLGLNINLRCQSSVWIQEDPEAPLKIFKISSGRSKFETTAGKFSVGWLIDDWYESRTYPEGWMYRPQFFNDGQAIHGSLEDAMVRSYPDSHGCVRMMRKDIDFLWSAGVGRKSQINIYNKWLG